MSNNLLQTNWKSFFQSVSNPLSSLQSKDYRLTVRCRSILAELEKSPEASFPACFKDKHQTKLLYRFLANSRISSSDILQSMITDSLDKIKALSLESNIIVAQDTTEFNFTTKPKTDLGYLHKLKHNGFLSHTALAITTDGLPIGILHQKNWVRDKQDYGKKRDRGKKPIQEKESHRWLECIQQIEALAKERQIEPERFIVTGDRESDILEILNSKTRVNLLIRCSHNRLISPLDSQEYSSHKPGVKPKLLDYLDTQKPQSEITIELTHSGHSSLANQEIVLTLKWTKLNLLKNQKKSGQTEFCEKEFYLVQAKSKNPEVNICWNLITTFEVNTEKEAKQIVYYYHLRWLVECFHYILKSGCKIEDLQLKERESLFKSLALYNIVASNILLLTYLARLVPNLSCLWIFSEIEWRTIHTYVFKQTPKKEQKPPSIQEVVTLLARIGGYIPNNRHPPGVKSLWTGLKTFNELVDFQLILNKENEGNG